MNWKLAGATLGAFLIPFLSGGTSALAAQLSFAISGKFVDVSHPDILPWKTFAGHFSYDLGGSEPTSGGTVFYPITHYTISFFGAASPSPLKTIQLDTPEDSAILAINSESDSYRLNFRDTAIFEDTAGNTWSVIQLSIAFQFPIEPGTQPTQAPPPGSNLGGDLNIGLGLIYEDELEEIKTLFAGVKNVEVTPLPDKQPIPEPGVVLGLGTVGLLSLVKRKPVQAS